MSTEIAIESEVPTFPMRRDSPLDPPPQMLRLLAEQPISQVKLWNGQTPWLITRYDDVKAVLASRAFSADVRREGYPKVSAALATYTEGLINHLDSPEHDVYRRMLAPEFMVKRVERLRPEVQATVDRLIDAMLVAGPPADLVSSLAFPFPATVTCALMGVPYSEHGYFLSLVEVFLGGTSTAEEAASALGEFREYLGKLVDDKMTSPTDDVLGHMASVHVASGACSREALITIAQLFLIAGFDTTINMIVLGVLTLLQHVDQLAILRSDPSLIPRATDELLRFLTVTHWGRHKIAIEDVEIGGQLIRAGDGVIAAQDTANRDPAVFEDPNVFDVRRDARGHLAFGHGVHQCIGAALARIELEVVYRSILERFPDLHLAEAVRPEDFKPEAAVYGARRLIVAW